MHSLIRYPLFLWCASIGLVTTSLAEPPTFAGQVAAILRQNCVSCHHPNGAGPFSLVTYDEAKRRSRQIAEVTASRFMPPWKPESGYGPALQHVRGLSDAQIALLGQWHEDGAPAGDLASLPPPPSFAPADDWTLGQPDLVLEFTEPYTLTAAGKDVYRNFVLPVPLTAARYVKAVEFLPEGRGAIHHATLLLDDSGWARAQDAADQTPGFGSMNLSNVSNPQGQFIGWTPGSIAYQVYPGTEWALQPGSDLVLQLHLLPTGKAEVIRPKIGFYFSDRAPTKISSFVLLSVRQIDIPAGEADYHVQEKITLPVATHVLGAYPHAHYLGKDLAVYALLPGGEKRGLLRIPDWDFNWQTDYRFQEPLALPAGTTLVMDYHYDNSAANPRNPSHPPRRVSIGWNSTDEMGEVTIPLYVDTAADLARLQEAQQKYDMAQEGGAAAYYYGIGVDFEQAGTLDQAERMFRASLQAQPGQPRVINSLGGILEKRGQTSAAEAAYREALKLDPTLGAAKLNLARLLHRTGREPATAERLALEVEQASPGDLDAALFLAQLRVERGDPAGAIVRLRTAVKAHPGEAYPQLQWGKALLMMGDAATARGVLTGLVGGDFANERSRSYASDDAIRGEASFALAILAQQAGDVEGFKRELAATLRFDPSHADALLASAAVAFMTGDRTQATTRLERLLSLPEDRQPPPEAILALLPFPAGPEIATEMLLRAGKKSAAARMLAAAAEMARQQNRPDWVDRLTRFRQTKGL